MEALENIIELNEAMEEVKTNKTEKSKFWYDLSELLSYNCLFNFVVGTRGGGKSYAFKKWAISDFLKTGKQFVYLRRFDTELKRVAKTFFNDIELAFPEYEFEFSKSGTYLIDGKVAGYQMPLTISDTFKSASFPEVNKICFDEFIIDEQSTKHHYLKNEVKTFLEFYETIARMRDVRVVFLGNALTITNPYFLYWDIKMPTNKKNIRKCKEDIIVQLAQYEEFIKAKKQTRFGKIISNTPYGDYNIDNKFLLDNNNFVQKKTPASTYFFTIAAQGTHYGVWIDYSEGIMTLSNSVDPSCRIKYALTKEDHTLNTLLLKSKVKGFHLEMLIKQFQLGNLRFENVNIKNIMYNILLNTF